ncbi:MAG: hypothetical protein GX061_04645 [Eubacteriaceae bacterium]|nr:hypothetical protein [Eubacteriaceae bacterium]
MNPLYSHAWLLWGEDMNLLRQRAREMITEAAGGDSERLKRRLENGSFSDCLNIAPENGKVLIDDVRFIQKYLSLAANEGAMKFVIIENAHNMTPQAQNAMLKMLEETAENRMIFLLALNTDNILPTVLSRVQSVKCEQTPSNSGDYSHKNELISLLEEMLLKGEIEAVFRAADYIMSDKNRSVSLLMQCYGIFSQIYKYRLGVTKLPEGLEYAARNVGAKCAEAAMERVNKAIYDLNSNASPLLAVQAMFIDIREEYYAENRWNQI